METSVQHVREAFKLLECTFHALEEEEVCQFSYKLIDRLIVK